MAPTEELLLRYAPEFASDTRIADFIADAVALHSITSWKAGSAYDQAMCLYAAHMMTKFPATSSTTSTASVGTSGPVTSRKAREWSESYSDPVGNAASSGAIPWNELDIMSTSYGRAYIRIRGTRAFNAPRIVSI